MRALPLRHLLCALLATSAGLAVAACSTSSSDSRFDPALDGLALTTAQPSLVLRGSTLVITGRSFVGAPYGSPFVGFEGSFDNGSETYQIKAELPARFVDLETLELDVDDRFLDLMGANEGSFDGSLTVHIDSSIDGKRHSSQPLPTGLELAAELTPTLGSLTDQGPVFVNDLLRVDGAGLLLGGSEGTTIARVEGCFQPTGSDQCGAVEGAEIELLPASAFDRESGSFAFAPQIAGIQEGRFIGEVTLLNRHAGGQERSSSTAAVDYDLSTTQIFDLGPGEISLGKYVSILGAGFVANQPNSNTVLEMRGEFSPEGSRPVSIDLVLVPEFVQGRELRYTINEDDALGQLVDLRYARGRFSGEITPVVSYESETARGDAHAFEVDLAPVKQVVYLDFSPQYLDALRSFGLRVMDSEIRQRVADIVRRDYRGINLEIRLEEPEDFSLYSTVEIGGADPNGLGLLGYDNTPGKDSGNVRLHDTIGGVNASTQEDGFPGFGGVFIESFFIFSEHPGELAFTASISDPLFDEIFDPFRPDLDGEPVRAADLSTGIVIPEESSTCPALDRATQIGCAARTLSSLIGSTLSHEIGHSLGLANPDGGDSHYFTDAPNRIMDAGGWRPFTERAELQNDGPAMFCDDAYAYLRTILPTSEPEDFEGRPTCF